MNPKLTFAYANATLKRKEHEYPTVSVDADIVDALRNYDVIMSILSRNCRGNCFYIVN